MVDFEETEIKMSEEGFKIVEAKCTFNWLVTKKLETLIDSNGIQSPSYQWFNIQLASEPQQTGEPQVEHHGHGVGRPDHAREGADAVGDRHRAWSVVADEASHGIRVEQTQ